MGENHRALLVSRSGQTQYTFKPVYLCLPLWWALPMLCSRLLRSMNTYILCFLILNLLPNSEHAFCHQTAREIAQWCMLSSPVRSSSRQNRSHRDLQKHQSAYFVNKHKVAIWKQKPQTLRLGSKHKRLMTVMILRFLSSAEIQAFYPRYQKPGIKRS